MPGIADLILAQEAEPDDLDIEDESLARELAELQARRRSHPAGNSNAGSIQINSAPAAAPVAPVEPASSGSRALSPPAGTPATGLSATGPIQQRGRSLADQILASHATSDNDVDTELEAMERELQQNLQDYRRQQLGPSATEEPPGAELGSLGPEDAELAGDQLSQKADELVQLRNMAARMDEAFPEMEEADAPDGNAEQAVAVPRRSALRNFDRVERDSAPLDEDWCDMKSALDDIEIRLRVMQSKEVLQIQKPDKDEDQEAPPSSAFVAEMQAQNKHLRELLASERKSHLLNL
ncbi:unnamed protein product, partial [Polarella glacialis]